VTHPDVHSFSPILQNSWLSGLALSLGVTFGKKKCLRIGWLACAGLRAERDYGDAGRSGKVFGLRKATPLRNWVCRNARRTILGE
jgi:hypothetical protein